MMLGREPLAGTLTDIETSAPRLDTGRIAILPEELRRGSGFAVSFCWMNHGCVRWCLHYGLSYRNAEKLLTERGIVVNHVTVFRWVQRFRPLLINAAQ
jgi:hypothetical protein